MALPEQVSRRFRMQALNEFYYSWGPAVADFNHDGTPDIVAGPYYYLGPDYTVAKRSTWRNDRPEHRSYFNGLQFTYDFTGDGWPDVFNVALHAADRALREPERRIAPLGRATPSPTASRSEFTLLKDVDGDGKLEFLFKDSENKFVYAKPDPANPTGDVDQARDQRAGPVGEPRHGRRRHQRRRARRFPERLRLVGAAGRRAATGPWTYHPAGVRPLEPLEPGRRRDGGLRRQRRRPQRRRDQPAGARLGAGVVRAEESARTGRSSFVEHPIMGDFSTKNAGGVTFSELHGSTFADIDGDGMPDFITGKRFWSHLDTFIDPDPHGAPVLYVYRTVRNPKAPGGAEFVPELIHNRSGVGLARRRSSI